MVAFRCYSCKGKLKCGRKFCFVYEKNKFLFKSIEKLGSEFDGTSPPSVFVGSKLKYPRVNVGVLSPPEKTEDAWIYDAQRFWAENNFSIDKVISYRSNLINSRFKANVLDVRGNNKFLELAQEIGMASKIVELEVKLKKKVSVKIDFSKFNLPMGPSAELENLKIGNTKISFRVDKVVSDTDLKSSEALNYLNKKGFDENFLTKLLSIGVLGLRKNRKLVPTRWSITSIHDFLGKEILKKVRDYRQPTNYCMFFGKYLGNYFLVMFFPEVFSYELFESYMPGSAWNPSSKLEVSTDYEDYYGRKDYASNCVGGYYASRLGILEYLDKIKRQANVLVLRFESDEYWASLGVWVVRESLRKVMGSNPVYFDSKEEMLKEARQIILNKFNYDIDGILKRSILLDKLGKQVKLTKFIYS